MSGCLLFTAVGIGGIASVQSNLCPEKFNLIFYNSFIIIVNDLFLRTMLLSILQLDVRQDHLMARWSITKGAQSGNPSVQNFSLLI